VALSNLLRMYRETGTMERCIVISPTFFSNIKLMENLDIDIKDVLSPDDDNVIQQLKDIVNGERDLYVAYQELKVKYKTFLKTMGNRQHEQSDIDEDLMLEFYDERNDTFRMPEPKYKCYNATPPRPPILTCFIDDCLCSNMFTDRKFPALVTKHRHLGAIPGGGAVGVSLFIAIQSYKATSGLPRVIRNQATSICLFRTKDRAELKQVSESFSGEVDPELFERLYDYATKDSPHDFLFVDLHKKESQPSMFRKNFDEYIILK